MKWFLTTFLVAGFVFFCYSAPTLAQFPKPRPAAAPAAAPAPVPAPPVQAAPVEVAPSPVVVAAPTAMDEIKSWLNTALAGLIAFFLGKIGFKPAPTQVVPVGAQAVDPVDAIRAKLGNTDLRGAFDNILGIAANSQLVRGGVVAGLGVVPVAGGLLSQLEPLINKGIKDALDERKAAAGQ